jgi:hypothetical protein
MTIVTSVSEDTLKAMIYQRASSLGNNTFANVRDWSGCGGLGNLSTTRGSFQLDTSGL